MLFQAGIEVTCYDMAGSGLSRAAGGDSGDAQQQMIVTLQHGWRGYEAREFLLQQGEVTLVEWDDVKSVPERLREARRAAGSSGDEAVPKAGGRVGKKRGRRRERLEL